MKVRNRFTDEVIGEFDISPGTDLSGVNLSGADLDEADLREANLRGTNLRDADLSWANLSGTDLYGVDLGNADLCSTDLNKADLSGIKGAVVIYSLIFPIIIQEKYTRIGCSYRPNEEWLAMSDEEAIKFGAKAEHLEFYRTQIRLGMEFLKATD